MHREREEERKQEEHILSAREEATMLKRKPTTLATKSVSPKKSKYDVETNEDYKAFCEYAKEGGKYETWHGSEQGQAREFFLVFKRPLKEMSIDYYEKKLPGIQEKFRRDGKYKVVSIIKDILEWGKESGRLDASFSGYLSQRQAEAEKLDDAKNNWKWSADFPDYRDYIKTKHQNGSTHEPYVREAFRSPKVAVRI